VVVVVVEPVVVVEAMDVAADDLMLLLVLQLLVALVVVPLAEAEAEAKEGTSAVVIQMDAAPRLNLKLLIAQARQVIVAIAAAVTLCTLSTWAACTVPPQDRLTVLRRCS
jgi:hypothetical protein